MVLEFIIESEVDVNLYGFRKFRSIVDVIDVFYRWLSRDCLL